MSCALVPGRIYVLGPKNRRNFHTGLYLSLNGSVLRKLMLVYPCGKVEEVSVFKVIILFLIASFSNVVLFLIEI